MTIIERAWRMEREITPADFAKDMEHAKDMLLPVHSWTGTDRNGGPLEVAWVTGPETGALFSAYENTPDVHIHVGANIPGYLPESDVTCFDSVAAALDALHHEIKDQQDYYFEGCTAESPEQQEKGSECCEWCSVALDCEADLSAIADGDAAYAFSRDRDLSYSYEPPEGANIRHWLTEIHSDRGSCEVFADQDS